MEIDCFAIVSLTPYLTSPALTEERLMYMNGTKDIFTGIRELLESQVITATKSPWRQGHFENPCE